MAQESTGFHFRVSANLLRIIGQELVASDEAAVLELVKNAYDSNARTVTITIEPISEKRVGFVKIQDDGQGMSRRDFEHLFMVAGYSERPEEAPSAKRVPTGEKGIGRFAASRLGSRLTVFTRAAAHEPTVLKIDFDWKKFQDKKKKFDEVLIPFEQVSSNVLLRGQTGTILEVTGLHSDWKPDKIEKLKAFLAELLDPFHKPGDFKIVFDVSGSEKLSGQVTQQPLTDADLDLEFRVLADEKVSRKLSFASLGPESQRESVPSNANTEPLVGLSGRYLYFLKRPSKQKSKGLPAGVRIYRDGVRLEPFGSPTADWLGVSEKRAKRAGHAHVVPSRLYGFIEISRIKHQQLKDTTGRQALIDNEAAQALVTVLREQLGFLEERIRTLVSEPKWEAGKQKKIIKLERARLHALGMLSAGLGHELRQPLQVIRTQTGNLHDRLSELSVNDPEINQYEAAIDRNIQRMDDSIGYIGNLAKGDVEKVDSFDLAEHLREDSRFFENGCRAKGIQLEVKAPQNQPARISQTGFSIVLLNLLNNAVDALDEVTERNDKRISILLSREGLNNLLEVTDNGQGIDEVTEKKLFKEFETGKTGGMGIGLYTCRVIVQAHGGEITYKTRIGLGTTFYVGFPDR
jgi:signal transduction histidine kinase